MKHSEKNLSSLTLHPKVDVFHPLVNFYFEIGIPPFLPNVNCRAISINKTNTKKGTLPGRRVIKFMTQCMKTRNRPPRIANEENDLVHLLIPRPYTLIVGPTSFDCQGRGIQLSREIPVIGGDMIPGER